MLASKPNVLGAHLLTAGRPGWGAQCGAPTLVLWGEIATVIILLFVDHRRRSMGLYYVASLCLLPSHYGSFFMLLVVDLSPSLPVFLITSCSVNSYNSGIPVGGGKPRVFLLCYFGHNLNIVIFKPK